MRSIALVLRRAALAAWLVMVFAPGARAATEEVAILKTSEGEIVWRFLPKEAPEHVAYVKSLIASGFYDGTTLHRVIPHFVVQGGDPNSRNDDRSDDGEGEADRRLKAEFSTRLHYRPGTVGMARDADPDSGSCQYFMALENLPRLDGRYTIFAEVVEGLDVARRIASLPRDLNDNPLRAVKVTIRLEKRRVPESIVSLDAGASGSGEVLTGPDKPKPFDPKNRLWTAPALEAPPAGGPTTSSKERLDVSIDPEGRVLDVRFVRPETPDSAALQSMARAWKFAPGRYEGKPRKTRIEIDADGGGLGPPTGGGAPIDLAVVGAAGLSGLTPPRPALRVIVPAGSQPPPKQTALRLTVDASGAVADAALQSSCGDAGLDQAAVEAALALAFEPAMRVVAGKKEPEPVPVYIDLTASFVVRSR